MISSAPIAQVIVVGLACGRDHAGAEMFRQLDRKGGDTAGAALDQDGFAGFQFQRVLDGADRRQSGQRQRCGIDMRHAGGLLGGDGRLDCDLFGVGALLADVANAEHLVADTQIRNACAYGGNHAGKIPPENVGEMRQLTGLALAHLPVRAVDAGGNDIDHDLAGRGDRIRHLTEFEDFRSAVAFDVRSLHGHSPM
jgi:hypothetical protein